MALVAGILLSIIALVQGMRPPVVQNYEVRLADLPHEMEKTVLVALSDLHLGALIGMPEYMNGIWYLSLMTVGVGFIAGRGGIAFIIGGFVAYWFLSPALSMMNAFPLDETGQVINEPGPLRLLLYRPFGIGMLIGGAVMGVILASPLIVSAVKSMQKAAKVTTGISKDEMPIKLLYFAVLGAAILLGLLLVNSTQRGALKVPALTQKKAQEESDFTRLTLESTLQDTCR